MNAELQTYLSVVRTKLDTVREWLDTIKKKYGLIDSPTNSELKP